MKKNFPNDPFELLALTIYLPPALKPETVKVKPSDAEATIL